MYLLFFLCVGIDTITVTLVLLRTERERLLWMIVAYTASVCKVKQDHTANWTSLWQDDQVQLMSEGNVMYACCLMPLSHTLSKKLAGNDARLDYYPICFSPFSPSNPICILIFSFLEWPSTMNLASSSLYHVVDCCKLYCSESFPACLTTPQLGVFINVPVLWFSSGSTVFYTGGLKKWQGKTC